MYICVCMWFLANVWFYYAIYLCTLEMGECIAIQVQVKCEGKIYLHGRANNTITIKRNQMGEKEEQNNSNIKYIQTGQKWENLF